MSIVTRQGREFNPHAGQSMSVFLLLKSLFLRNLNTADKSIFFFFDFKVVVGIYLHQSHVFHIPHPTDPVMVSQGT